MTIGIPTANGIQFPVTAQRVMAVSYTHLDVYKRQLGLWGPQSDARYPYGHYPYGHTFSPFLPVCLNVVFLSLPQSLTAALFRSLCSRKRSWQNHIPSSRSFSCNRQNKKADTQRHQKSAGVFLSLQNDVLCNGFEIQKRDCLFICPLADSTKKHRVQTAVFSLSIPQALGGCAAFIIQTSCIQL